MEDKIFGLGYLRFVIFDLRFQPGYGYYKLFLSVDYRASFCLLFITFDRI